jgi:hypothetical protein
MQAVSQQKLVVNQIDARHAGIFPKRLRTAGFGIFGDIGFPADFATSGIALFDDTK